jgi:hypothetical protein
MTSIETLWDQLAASDKVAGALRVDDIHPCDLYAAIDAEGRLGLVLVTDVAPPSPPALEVVTVTANPRQDGRFSLAFWLQVPALRTPFAHLCEDLVDESRSIEPASAGSFLLARLARWRRLLKGERGLSLSEIRGLVGELVVLIQCLDIWPPATVIEGWMGPLEAAQDFILPSRRIETKAIQPDARVVRISSADQLDHTGSLSLAVVTMATVLTESTGVTPRNLVDQVRELLVRKAPESVLVKFEGRLTAGGFADLEADSSLRFRIDDVRYFDVELGFPAITRMMLPDGVAEARYDIELSALLPFSSTLSAS